MVPCTEVCEYIMHTEQNALLLLSGNVNLATNENLDGSLY